MSYPQSELDRERTMYEIDAKTKKSSNLLESAC